VTLLAYLALVVAVAAVCCGHQGEPFPIPLRGAWRALRGRQQLAEGDGPPLSPARRLRGPYSASVPLAETTTTQESEGAH
jgi:hypothetical protein